MNMYEGIVRSSPMFRSAHPSLIKEIVTRLAPVAYNAGDWIFHEGDVGHEMMYVGSGILEVGPELGDCYRLSVRSSKTLKPLL